MRTLVLVDVQNDFVPGGALPVPGGDEIVPVVNSLQPRFDLVVATQDWHPPGHKSFASSHDGKEPGDVIDLDGARQTLWPDHCVQGTSGAEFVSALDTGQIDAVFKKGVDPRVDSYSGFFDNARKRATGLAEFLKGRHATDVFIAGLATDYCVKYTALDAVELGFNTFVIGDACRGIDLNPGDVEAALDEMRAAGVRLVESRDILKYFNC